MRAISIITAVAVMVITYRVKVLLKYSIHVQKYNNIDLYEGRFIINLVHTPIEDASVICIYTHKMSFL